MGGRASGVFLHSGLGAEGPHYLTIKAMKTFWALFVLVLSIAVLVLVLDRTLRNRLCPLNQASQH